MTALRVLAPSHPDAAPVEPQRRPDVELAACLATFREWLHLPDAGPLLVTLATVVANRGEGDPVWLLLVGPPGGGKTEIINPLSRQRDVHVAATLTEGALLSGVAKRDRVNGAKGGLLREIGDFGILVHKDFGSVLSMNRDTRAAVLAALREIYDGSWTRHVGTDGGRTLSWSGKVALIAGCTPAIDGHHAVIGSMGERFVLYRLPSIDADVQVRRALGHVGKERQMRGELSTAVDNLLSAVDTAAVSTVVDSDTTERLVRLATLAVRCRSAVERDSYSREITLIPEAEAPARLSLVLLRLLNALRAIGVDDATAWALVGKCALDSMPAIRRTVLDDLMGNGTSTTSAVAERVNYPTSTARRALEDLTAHGIAERESQGSGKPDLWQVSTWARDRWPTVPEMSGGTCADAQIDAESRPSSISHLSIDDFSGKVPEPTYIPVEDDYPPSAWQPFDEEPDPPSAFDEVMT